MNKINWVDGRYTTPQDFNAMQSNPENHLRSQAKVLLSGYNDIGVTGSAAGLSLSPGVAWDPMGRRIFVPAAAEMDVSSVDRPASGQYRWLRVSASYRQVERDTMRDKEGVDQPAYYDDGYAVALTTGPEFTASTLNRARRTTVGKPAVPGGAVSLALFVIDHDSNWATVVENKEDYDYPPPPAARFIPGRIVPVAVGNTSGAVYTALADIVPPDGSPLYGWGAVWCTNTPPTGRDDNDTERWYPVTCVRRTAQTRIAIFAAAVGHVPSLARSYPENSYRRRWLANVDSGGRGRAVLSAMFFVQ